MDEKKQLYTGVCTSTLSPGCVKAFIMADMANDKAMINELTYGEKDLHTLTAKIVFPEIPKDMPVEEVKEPVEEKKPSVRKTGAKNDSKSR